MARQPSQVRDPVCGMEIDSENATAITSFEGQTFYFCRLECQEKFNQNPEGFAKAA